LAKNDGMYRRMYQMQSGGFLDENADNGISLVS